MPITYPNPDQSVIDKITIRLEEFKKLRVGYIDPSLSLEEKNKEKERVKGQRKETDKKNKKSFIKKFFFSDYN